jgi:hypothetical protein
MTAAETYATHMGAVGAQRLRLHGPQPPGDRFGGPVAQRFRSDPHRSLDANVQVIASYVQPDDVLIDVGGGAGRVSLPLALRCRQVINIDASPGMLAGFEACAAEAGITTARSILADWLAAADVTGDVALASSVTYFVRDIVPFIEKMVAASRQRVIMTLWSVPTANQTAPLFHLVYGEEQAPVPGYRELLPVVWEMGILADVRVLPDTPCVLGMPLPVRSHRRTRRLCTGRCRAGGCGRTTRHGHRSWSRPTSMSCLLSVPRVCGRSGTRRRDSC